MKLRIFGHYIFFPLVLLGFAELIAMLIACWLGTLFAAPFTGQWQFMWGPSALLAACVFASMAALGLYNKRQRDRLNGTMVRAVLGVFVGGVVARCVALVWPDLWSPLSIMAGSMVMACALLLLTRVVGQRVMDGNTFRRRILVLGSGRFAARVLHLRRRADQRAFKLIGFVAVQGDDTAVPINSIIKLQGSLIELTRSHRIDEIVIAIDDRRRNYPVRELLNCRLAGVEISELATKI